MSQTNATPRPSFRPRQRTSTNDWTLFLFLIVPVLGIGACLGYESTLGETCLGSRTIFAASRWFDPLFFQYNLILAAIAIAIVPSIPFLYVRAMAWRKKERLCREVPHSAREHVGLRLDNRGQFRFYFGSTLISTAVVALGIAILLLFKPVWGARNCGVDFSKGANMLMSGPFMNLFDGPGPLDPTRFYDHLIDALAGFQFGFLGAYIYFLIALTRAYFTLDLTPETLVDGAIRISVASVLSLVLSFQSAELLGRNMLPIVSFFFGFFPDRALAFLEQLVLKLVKLGQRTTDQSIPLSVLHGVSYAHQVRLEREGFDNAENLSHANPVDLAIRTGFSFKQLQQWVSEARLACHLREDYARFVRRTGIMSQAELERYFSAVPGEESVSMLLPVEETIQETTALRAKVTVIRAMLQPEAACPPAATTPEE